MDHAKKMVLISSENLKRLHKVKEEDETITNQLDKDMKNILKLKLSEYEKWKMYQEILQRYLYFQQQNREPIKLTIEQEPPTEGYIPSPKHLDIDQIVNVIPKTHRERARLLMNKLENNKSITWNEKGTVSINDKQILNSNISDLVGDIVRFKKNNNPPGWLEFLKELKNINIPLELVNNPERKKLIKQEPELKTTTENKLNNADESFEDYKGLKKAVKRKWKRFSFS